MIHSFPPRAEQKHEIGREVLRAEGVGTEGKLRDASFSLKEGEILGIAGLQGMGQLDLFLSIFGAMPLRKGHFSLDGKKVAISSPRDAISARIGISLVLWLIGKTIGLLFWVTLIGGGIWAVVAINNKRKNQVGYRR